jgi:serine/threonine protein phosphatase PrpC
MSAIQLNDNKKEYKPTISSVFDSPECSNEDTNSLRLGTSTVVVTDTLSIEIAAVFDGHGGDEASMFLKENFVTCFIASIEKELTLECATYQSIIDDGVIAADAALCEHLRTLRHTRDIGSTMSMWINFITPSGNNSYLATVGDSPAYAFCRATGVITRAALHDIKDVTCQEDAKLLPHITVITHRNNRPILDICIRSPTVCEMIPSGTMMYLHGMRSLNIPRSLGHIHWNNSINKHPEIIKVPDDADTIVLMSDGVSDMMVDVEEYLHQSMLLQWDVEKVGSFYRDRWYQPWKQSYKGRVSDEDTHIAIKGHTRHIADDMTIVQVILGKI